MTNEENLFQTGRLARSKVLGKRLEWLVPRAFGVRRRRG
jgi:hypothetical protein